MLFKNIVKQNGRIFKLNNFIAGYLLLIIIYVFIWYFAPVVAFLLFLLVSAYHFGQSNWPGVRFEHFIQEKATNLLWGSAVIGVPVLLHFQQSAVIISEMTGWLPVLSDAGRGALIFVLVFSNLAIITHLHQKKTIDKRVFGEEISKFLLLMMLFFSTPLLVGFGVYFVLWHSLTSMQHQIQALKEAHKISGVTEYILKALPLSLISIISLFAGYHFFGDIFDEGQNMGILFLFLAIITVPHAALMEWFYRSHMTY